VAALQPWVLDVRAGRFGHPRAVEREQRDERVLGGRAEPGGGRAEPGGDRDRAEFVAVQRGGVRLVIQPGTADVRGRGVLEEFFFDGDAGGQFGPLVAGDRGARPGKQPASKIMGYSG